MTGKSQRLDLTTARPLFMMKLNGVAVQSTCARALAPVPPLLPLTVVGLRSCWGTNTVFQRLARESQCTRTLAMFRLRLPVRIYWNMGPIALGFTKELAAVETSLSLRVATVSTGTASTQVTGLKKRGTISIPTSTQRRKAITGLALELLDRIGH